jgi:hypothetical protein
MRDEEISRPNNQILARPATTSKVKGGGGDEQGKRLWCLPKAVFSVRCAGYMPSLFGAAIISLSMGLCLDGSPWFIVYIVELTMCMFQLV